MKERNRYVVTVDGKPVEGLSGWKDRQEAAKRKASKWYDPARMAMRQERARAAAAAAAGIEAPKMIADHFAEEIAQDITGDDDFAVEDLGASNGEDEDAIERSEKTLADLRAEYERVFGEKPHHRKTCETLEREIAEAMASNDGTAA